MLKRIAVFGAAVALTMSFPGLAQADTEPAGPAARTTVLKYSGGECEMKSDNPHWSRGAQSVIFKTRVECAGTEAPTVRITGDMFYVEGGLPGLPSDAPTRPVGHSELQQVVPIGDTVTYYTPLEDDPSKLTALGTYQGTAVGEIVAPVHSNLNPFTTARAYVVPRL